MEGKVVWMVGEDLGREQNDEPGMKMRHIGRHGMMDGGRRRIVYAMPAMPCV